MKDDRQLGYRQAHSLRFLFHRQLWHLISLLILIPITWAFAAPAMTDRSWMGMTDITWFWLAIAVPIVHQVIVWVVFRLQLGWGTLSRVFGDSDLLVWAALFIPFLIGRVITIGALAHINSDTLALPKTIAFPLAFALLIPALYTLYSVFRYFGIIRAIGADHFRISYKEIPLVREGIFKWSDNAMYAFAFLALWSIALFQASQAALIVALFQHAYIWVHYFCTEKPDMDIIYGDRDEN